MKTVIIGQAPSKRGDPANPLSRDPVASRLAGLFGVTKDEYLERFDRINLIGIWPGKKGKGDAFPMAEAAAAAEKLKDALLGRTVLFLGVATAKAFRYPYDALEWHSFNEGLAAVLPHPSGVNRWWNDEGNSERASVFCRRMEI